MPAEPGDEFGVVAGTLSAAADRLVHRPRQRRDREVAVLRIARSSGAFAAVRGREPRQRCASNSGAMPSSRITAGRSPVSNAATTCAHEFAAAQRPGVPEQQDRGVAAFEDLVRPPGDLGAGLATMATMSAVSSGARGVRERSPAVA
ncbi:hypothetical protein GQ85_01145 [Rhodococcus rhodochrous]|nr:hypothetical protein GQ85_01145 [Rhodococcus rhodochrous]